MIVLGTDPGIATFGWGEVDCGTAPRILAADTVTTAARRSLPERWAAIRTSLESVPIAPELVVYEEQAGVWQGVQRERKENPGGRLPQVAVGAIIDFAVGYEIPVIGLQPNTIKKLSTGNGRATKHQVAAIVSRLPGCPERMSGHAADAIATAIAGWIKWRSGRR